MARVVRYIIFEGEEQEVLKQLGLSMPDGIKKVNNNLSITVKTVISDLPNIDSLKEQEPA